MNLTLGRRACHVHNESCGACEELPIYDLRMTIYEAVEPNQQHIRPQLEIHKLKTWLLEWRIKPSVSMSENDVGKNTA